MEWTQITSLQLEQLRDTSGVCIVPFGCLERHSDHLPIGTDSLLAYKLAVLAAEQEASVVFPPQHYMMVASASAQPGAISFDAKLAIQITETAFEEIARNGFKKIMLYNFHGGNRHIVPLLLQNHLSRQPRSYTLYMPEFDWEIEDVHKTYCDSNFGGHADEWETSLMLYLFPESVHMDKIPSRHIGHPQNRLSHLQSRHIKTPVNFYSDYPTHYAGEAQTATAEKGKRAAQVIINRLAENIKAVKNDDKTLRIQEEFHKNMHRYD